MTGSQLVLECCMGWGEPPYPQPCPNRMECCAFRCETGGCDGERGWCTTAQLAAGREPPDWRVKLMSAYERRHYERKGWL